MFSGTWSPNIKLWWYNISDFYQLLSARWIDTYQLWDRSTEANVIPFFCISYLLLRYRNRDKVMPIWLTKRRQAARRSMWKEKLLRSDPPNHWAWTAFTKRGVYSKYCTQRMQHLIRINVPSWMVSLPTQEQGIYKRISSTSNMTACCFKLQGVALLRALSWLSDLQPKPISARKDEYSTTEHLPSSFPYVPMGLLSTALE